MFKGNINIIDQCAAPVKQSFSTANLDTVETPSSAVDITIIEPFTRLRDHLWSLPAACLMLEIIAVFLSFDKNNQCRP